MHPQTCAAAANLELAQWSGRADGKGKCQSGLVKNPKCAPTVSLPISSSFRSGTMYCRPHTPHRCQCTGASSDAGISLKLMSCCRSLAKSPSTGRTCDLVTWILGVMLILEVGVSEQFSRSCEIEVLVVYEVEIRKSPS